MPRLAAVAVPMNPTVASTATNAAPGLRELIASSGVSTQLLARVAENKPLTLPDLDELGQKKVDDAAVLNYLRTIDTVYVLRAAELEQLRQAGVSESILDYLLATRLQPTIIPYDRPYPVYPGYYPYYDPFYSPFYRPYYYPHRYYHHPGSVIRKK